MVKRACSAMAQEISESSEVVLRILRDRRVIADVAKRLGVGMSPLAVLCGL